MRTSKRHSKSRRRKSAAAENSSSRTYLTRVLFYLCLICFLAVSIYSLFYAPFLSVSRIEVSGLKKLSAQTITDHINAEIAGENKFKVLRANLILISKESLESSLLSKFPEMRSVRIRKIFPDALLVDVMEYETIFLICGRGKVVLEEELQGVDKKLANTENGGANIEVEEESVALGDVCVALDKVGRVQEIADMKADRYTHNELLTVSIGSEVPTKKGDAVLTQDTLENLIYLQRELPFRIGARITGSPIITSLGSTHATLTTDEGWKLVVDLAHEPVVTLSVLKVFFDQSSEVNIRSRLRDVDLRLLDKVFYRTAETAQRKEQAIEQVSLTGSVEQEIEDNEVDNVEEDSVSPSPEKKTLETQILEQEDSNLLIKEVVDSDDKVSPQGEGSGNFQRAPQGNSLIQAQ